MMLYNQPIMRMEWKPYLDSQFFSVDHVVPPSISTNHDGVIERGCGLTDLFGVQSVPCHGGLVG